MKNLLIGNLISAGASVFLAVSCVINDKRKNRFLFRKDVLVKEGYDPAKTEHQIMLDRCIYRIYDCGTKVYYL